MIVKRISLFIICTSMLLTTGCWDKVEIDDRAFSLALAIDVAEKGKVDTIGEQIQEGVEKNVGEENKIKTIFYTPIPSKLIGGEVNAFSVEEAEGNNMSMAIENLNMKFSRNIFLGEMKNILIGERALKNPVILRKLMDFIERDPDMGRGANIAVVKGKVSSLIDVKPKFEKVFGAYLNGVFGNSSRVFSNLKLSINEFLSAIRENKGKAVMPVIQVEGNEVSIKQLALLKDYKFHEYVDAKYLRAFAIMTNNLSDGQIIIPYKKDIISLNVTSADTNLSITKKKGKLVYKISARIEGDVNNYIFNEDIFHDKSINEIRDKIKKEIKEELNKGIDYFQNDIGIDYIGAGEYMKKHNYNLYRQYEKNWDQEFKKMKIDFDVQVFIRRLGGTRG